MASVYGSFQGFLVCSRDSKDLALPWAALSKTRTNRALESCSTLTHHHLLFGRVPINHPIIIRVLSKNLQKERVLVG